MYKHSIATHKLEKVSPPSWRYMSDLPLSYHSLLTFKLQNLEFFECSWVCVWQEDQFSTWLNLYDQDVSEHCFAQLYLDKCLQVETLYLVLYFFRPFTSMNALIVYLKLVMLYFMEIYRFVVLDLWANLLTFVWENFQDSSSW